MAAAALGLAALMAGPGADGAAAEPPEPIVLPGTTIVAITADIDHDGEGELVRLVDGTAGGAPSLEGWDMTDGGWVRVLEVSGDDLAPDGGPLEPGRTGATIANLRVDGRDGVVLVTTAFDPSSGLPCCLTMHEVTGDAGGYSVRTTSSADAGAEFIAVVDLDGDGTDELAATAIDWTASEPDTEFTIFRRGATSWGAAAAWTQPGSWFGLMPADTDGRPGGELLAIGGADDLLRLSWAEGRIVTESIPVGHFEVGGGHIAGTLGELVVHVGPETVSLISWPAGEASRVVASRRVVGFPHVGVAGSGADALVLVHQGFELGHGTPTTTVLDASLEPLGEVAFRAEAAALWSTAHRRDGWMLGRFIWPSLGPIAPGLAGPDPAYLIGGVLVRRDGDTFYARPATPIVGYPIGPIGAGGEWAALVDVHPGATTYLQSGPSAPDARVVLLPAERLFDPEEASRPVVEVTLEGGIEVGDVDGVTRVLASAKGMDFVVAGPPGALAVAWDGTGMMDLAPASIDGSQRIGVAPPRQPGPDEEASFERVLIAIGPNGNASVHAWEGIFAPETPELTAWTEVEAFSLEATVAGRVGAGTTVTVNGREVAVNGFGAYRTTVEAPPWPRDVVVVARDPFGGEQRSTVQVIGLVDYRGLPWAPIAGVVTVLAGVVLFLRTPRARPAERRSALDDGRLEDLDGDLI